MKKIHQPVSVLLSVVMIFSMLTMVPFGAGAAETAPDVQLKEGTYVPNQVVVLFKNSAIDVQTRPDKGDLAPVGADFGDMMDASSSKNEALSAADEEVNILKKSLGGDFVLEDTLVFDEPKADSKAGEPVGASLGADSDELTIALVSSGKYDTATLIQKLSKNRNVAKVEPNYIYDPTSFDDYSLNDAYSSYLYHVNSTAAKNTGGDSVDDRGVDPETALSTNASSAWSKVTDTGKEVVVAVVDSGVLETHEDLKDVMWTNPGDIGLKGVHGYNFAENKPQFNDTVGHGTHCAGIIAAQANNLKGIAGIGSAANVKIMALQILSGAYGSATSYCVIGAYNYIHKAVQGGVNVVAVNNSWGGRGYSTVYDEVIGLLGEDGVVSCYAAGNDSINNDRVNTYPANTESEYAVTVGAADITGQPGKFSDYGKSSVDVFAPGVNILSTVSRPVYYPQLYDAARFNSSTAYYGEFNANTRVENGAVTPSVGSKANETVKSFGSLQFVRQTKPGYEVDEAAPEASLDLSVVHDRHFDSENPYRLKLTVKQAHFGEEYYIFFPFEKDALTTGDDNTAFSVAAESIPTENGSGEWFNCGEVIRQEDGTLAMFYEGGSNGNGIMLCSTLPTHDGIVRHITNEDRESGARCVMSAEEADGKLLGLGVYVSGGEEPSGEPQDLSLYLDNIAVSKPDVTFDPNDSYDVMSGTSMACPSVTGAGALIAALNPRLDGESGGDYAKRIRTLLLSCSRQTDVFRDICSTGGYTDLSLLGAGAPVITDAVCDVENETLTLTGENLAGRLTYRSLFTDGATEQPLPGGMTVDVSDDGRQLVIHNAKSLFSTYTAFSVTAANGLKGEGKFFLVKGQRQLEPVSSYLWPQGQAQEPPSLVASADGKQLFGYFQSSAQIAHFDGSQFNTINNTDLALALKNNIAAESGDYYAAYNDYKYEIYTPEVPLNENGVIYSLGSVTALQSSDDSDSDDGEADDNDDDDGEVPDDNDDGDEGEAPGDDDSDGEEDPVFDDGIDWYLCRLDLGDAQPRWTFSAISDLPAAIYSGTLSMNSCFANGKLYCIAKPLDPQYSDAIQTSLEMYSFDVTAGEWTQEPELPVAIEGFDFVSSNGKLYVFGGFTPDDHKTSADDRMVQSVYCFDGNAWSRKNDINIVGRYSILSDNAKVRTDAVTQVRNGLLFVDTSVEGGGNVFVYNTNNDMVEPLYYTLNDSVTNAYTVYNSCAATTDGVYYLRHKTDDTNNGWELFLLPESSCAYKSPYAEVILGDADGDGQVTIADATEIQKYLAEFPMTGTFQLKACDVDRDGAVTIADVTAVQRYLADMSAPAGIGFSMDETDPLSLWTAYAPLKSRLIAYVKTVTDEKSPDFIPVKDRIAVFDMDGTLCCETDPGYFDHKLLYHRVMEDPDYKDQASDFEKEVCADIETYFETGVYPSGMDVRHGTAVATAFKGMTMAEFDAYVKAYRDTPMESYTNMTNGQAFYKPMLQVVDYLQANDFKVYIVSGTDRFITRGLADGMVNIPLAQMIGSDESLVATGQGDTDGLKYTFTHDDELITGGEFLIKNLKMNKVTVIQQEIGLQPVLAFGNSSGDAAMANYTITNNKYKSGAFLLCCDDLVRENGNLSKAESMRQSCEENGWTAVSMKNDWTTIYGDGVTKK